MKKILIAKLGSTIPSLAASHGDFEDWISARLNQPGERVQVVDVANGAELPDPRTVAGVILTGSHGMVTDREPWSERTARWIPTVVNAQVPLLGICYGHQLMAQALGGESGWNPRGREFGTVEVELQSPARVDPLFSGLPQRLLVQACHAQSVLRLPDGATCLASNAHDPHHAFVVGKAAWGVQFHPEFDPVAAKTYIALRADALRNEGKDPEQLRQSVAETPQSEGLLRRFAEFVFGPYASTGSTCMTCNSETVTR